MGFLNQLIPGFKIELLRKNVFLNNEKKKIKGIESLAQTQIF